MNWHFGVSVAARSAPLRHVRIVSRLIFTEDGQKPFDDPAKMHRLRRSFAKTWRNARWRDMLLAFLHWLADGETALAVPVSSEEDLILGLPPITWDVPVSLPVADEDPERDDDDPSDDEEPEHFDAPNEDDSDEK
ncbi:MAG: TIR domain-containing protein, partial [Henriciella sp.]